MIGISIDADKIAQGIIEMLPHEYKSALKLGMLPAPFMEILEKQLGEKADQIAREQAAKHYGSTDGLEFTANKEWKAEFVRDCMKQIQSAFYRHGNLIV